MDRRKVSPYYRRSPISVLPIFLTQFADLGLDDVRGILVLCLVKVVERFCSRATSIRSKNLAPPNVVVRNTERLTPKLDVQSGG